MKDRPFEVISVRINQFEADIQNARTTNLFESSVWKCVESR